MTDPALDHTSRRILQLLAADGRASYQAVADEIGLSRPAVMERVKRLEEAGFIRGYHARLDRPKSGFPITAFVAIRYSRQRRRRAAHPGARRQPARPRVPPRRGRRLLRAQGGRALHREPRGRAARDQAARPVGQHPDHDRALHPVREAGHRPGGGRLMAGLRGRALIAYLLVCTVWGSTYLAIRIGVMHLPPFLFAGVRFIIAGLILAGVMLATGDHLPQDAARLEGPRRSPACSCCSAGTPSWSGPSSTSSPARPACSWPRFRSGRRSSTRSGREGRRSSPGGWVSGSRSASSAARSSRA